MFLQKKYISETPTARLLDSDILTKVLIFQSAIFSSLQNLHSDSDSHLDSKY